MKDFTKQFEEDIDTAIDTLEYAARLLDDYEQTEREARNISETASYLRGILHGMHIERSGELKDPEAGTDKTEGGA